jgi:hypothetical protein
MAWYNGGITDGRLELSVAGAREPRRVDLVRFEAFGDRDASAKLGDAWRATYGEEPPSAPVGISHPY